MIIEKLLSESSAELGVNLDSLQINRFLSYLELIKNWNSKINLTSVTEDEEIIIKHFIDSLTISEFIEDGSTVLDIGTGAGFPAVPLAIARESLKITALDSREKRIFFINEVIRELGIKNLETAAGRAGEDSNSLAGKSFDCVVTRAVGDIKDVVELSLPFVNKDGLIILMRGKEGRFEWESYENIYFRLNTLKELTLPGTGFRRVVLVLSKK